MVGSAGPTMVWSSAPRNRPSMTAKRISNFARWLNPRAGSSSRVGALPLASVGNASIGSVLPWGLVGVKVGVRSRECGFDRFAQVGQRDGHAGELPRVELVEDSAQDLLADGLDLVQH